LHVAKAVVIFRDIFDEAMLHTKGS